MEFSGVFFDLDGTLADTARDLAGALNTLLALNNQPHLPFSAIRPHVSYGTPALLQLAFDVIPSDLQYEGLRKQFLAIYKANLCEQTQLFPGITLLLQQLDQQQIPWGIITNKPLEFTTPLLEKLQLNKRAAIVLAADSLPEKKPHPLPLLHSCEQLHLKPQDCVYIGDALTDIQAANAAGMLSVAAAWGYLQATDQPQQWQADTIIQNSQDLASWIFKPS